MFNVSRRNLLSVASTAVLQSQLSAGRLQARSDSNLIDPIYNAKTLDGALIRRIAENAVQSAMDAGAKYCDIRLAFKEFGSVVTVEPGAARPKPGEDLSIGIRSFVGNSWGFASGSTWSEKEAVRLGKESVLQATLNNNVSSDDSLSELLANSGDSKWTSIGHDDPFDIPWERMYDFCRGLQSYIETNSQCRAAGIAVQGLVSASYSRERRIFLSSSSRFIDQLFGSIYGSVDARMLDSSGRIGSFSLSDTLTPALAGFNYLDRPTIRDEMDIGIEDSIIDMTLPVSVIEPGKYNVLLPPSSVAPIIYESIGLATELDRILGLEANSSGTSYLTDQAIRDGGFKIGSKNLNVTCSRSYDNSITRVGWDDEGIRPKNIEIVKDGLVTDVQRDVSGSEWCLKNVASVSSGYSSSGSAVASSAFHYPKVSCGHLTLQGKPDGKATVEELRLELESGLELHNGMATFDYAKSTGQLLSGTLYRIQKGRKVEKLEHSSMMFRTLELWNSIEGIGSDKSSRYFALSSPKGENNIAMAASVSTPPLIFKELSFVDLRRKA